MRSRSRISCALVAAATTLLVTAPARADQMIDPDQLPPKAREYALRGPLGGTDPYGNPANAGCSWSRVQVPTAQGLKWMVREECILNFANP